MPIELAPGIQKLPAHVPLGAPHACAHRLFEAHAARTPSAVAALAGEDSLTYHELNRRANRLAHRLRREGVGPETVVAIGADRTLSMLVAWLAVWKAGGATLLLDPALPPARLAFMLEQAHARVLIAGAVWADRLPQTLPRLCPERDAAALACEPDHDLAPLAAPDNLACVFFTSGSTGLPRGVLNTHGSLANYLAFLIVEFGLGPHDVVLQLVSPSFDPVIREVMGPLSAGASLLLTGTAGVPEPALALRLLAGRRVSCLLAVVPTYLRALLESAAGGVYLPALRLLLTTGEPLRPADVREAQRRLGAQVEVVNQYGPAECTQTTSFYRAGLANSGGSVPIGGPIRNAYWRLLDERLWPVPAGETGELFIGGAGVSRGYAGRPDWTAERFVPDPYSAIAGARLYRTGDLARARAGGNLEFVGRVDLQIKLRGNRVEPAEIEARLTAHPAVQSAAVVLRADARGEARLAAYWVSRPGAAVGRGDLRSWLAYSLPDYMLPSTYIQVRALPLTASGKVDRLALPAPNGARPLDPASYVAPLTPVEACLAEIWSDVLRLDQVGIYDSFFELGGHSLHAMQVVARINQTWAVDLSVRVLFDAPVIAALAVAVTQQLAGRVPEAELTRLLVELRVATRGRRTP